jgi:hypothetical protein
MWTVQINNIENGVINIRATEESGFSFASVIKVGSEDEFVQRVKEEFVKYQELHKDDISLKSSIENKLNS